MSVIRNPLRVLVLTLVALAPLLGLALAGAGPANAQTGTIQELKFAPGTNGASVSGAVVRGTFDQYLVEAYAGQTMLVDVTSVEDNASFTIVSPSGDVIIDRTAVSVDLPESGYYTVEVGPTRGNATYVLTVTIV